MKKEGKRENIKLEERCEQSKNRSKERQGRKGDLGRR